MTGEMVPIYGSNLTARPDMAPTFSVQLSRPCSGILALFGTCGHHSHSKLYYLCHLASNLF